MKGNSLFAVPREYVAIDLETTGLSSYNNEIIEFAGVRVVDGEIVEELSFLIRPQKRISYEITCINGITNEMVKDSPPLEAVLPEILAFIGDSVIVGHNVNFDISFLYVATERLLKKAFSNDFVDTMALSRRLFPQHKHHRLSDLVERFGVGHTVKHRALADAVQAHECLQYMAKFLK